ncbi:MAG: energy-coupling factor transporter transmembrane protein EcfT [Clostridia bacterium]|nr:energy-coupling factor transporter transmembrane protein EcfT [Clostridia bacterium]
MIKDITIGQYIPGDSLVHKADPRTKIILTLAYLILIFMLNTYFGFLMYGLFTILITVGSNIPVKYTLKGLKPVLFIVIFTVVINIFTVSGTPISDLPVLNRITYEGIDLSVKMALRLMLLIMGASLLTFTTTPIALTDGIEKLMKPLNRFNVPVHEIAMMMAIALRFIPTILEETEKIIKAQAARGADFDTGNLMQRAKSFIPVLVPLFISAFRRADDLATAMEARCYRGSVGRTRMKQLRFSSSDIIVTAIMILFASLVFGLQLVI